MGQSLQIYTVNNKGYLPWGDVCNDSARAPWVDPSTKDPNSKEADWWWYYTISETLNGKILGPDGTVARISPIFRDKDTIDGTDGRYVNHYTANPRILYGGTIFEGDSAPVVYEGYPAAVTAKTRPLTRKIATIKPSGVFVIWDAPQCADQSNNAYYLAIELDGNQWSFGHCFCLNTPSGGVNYDRPVSPGGLQQSQNASLCKIAQTKFNRDLLHAFASPDGWSCQIRFRHMNNTRLAALCLDGHVETRHVGEFMLKDICTNYRQ
jgi:hypothetical protein